MNVRIEFFEGEKTKVMQAIEFLEDLFDMKPAKPPKIDPESGKQHFYLESKDHKRKTKLRRRT